MWASQHIPKSNSQAPSNTPIAVYEARTDRPNFALVLYDWSTINGNFYDSLIKSINQPRHRSEVSLRGVQATTSGTLSIPGNSYFSF
jgi:hypothetical protein